MDYIKEAFNRVKQEVDFLKYKLNDLENELKENRRLMIVICESVQELINQKDQAHQQINPIYQENIPTDNNTFKPLNTKNLGISSRNEGVPADRQTDRQTDRQAKNTIENAAEILKSLDNIKKEIHKKFKKLTEQEWLVFSTVYQFDEEIGYSDYKILAEKLKLTESSIRDYISRLIKKGIPLDKIKLNNKNIRLNISQSLKQIASLSTIIALRDL